MRRPKIDLRPGLTEPVFLCFTRREVQACDPAGSIARLQALLDGREAAWRYRGQMILGVAGYEADPRELVDVPEVRAFLGEFNRRWPYWAYYFNQVDGSIPLLASCLCARHHFGKGRVELDPGKLKRFLLQGFAAMNSIFDRYGFDEEELRTISDGVIEVIEQVGVE